MITLDGEPIKFFLSGVINTKNIIKIMVIEGNEPVSMGSSTTF